MAYVDILAVQSRGEQWPPTEVMVSTFINITEARKKFIEVAGKGETRTSRTIRLIKRVAVCVHCAYNEEMPDANSHHWGILFNTVHANEQGIIVFTAVNSATKDHRSYTVKIN